MTPAHRHQQASTHSVDVFIIGGGINGTGIARDASGRGLKVALAEQTDLAAGTSSASSKLIHGGLRYLEHYEFGLVRESLMEREILWQLAPHLIRPLRFVLPHHSGLRPALILRLGLFLYDHLGGRKLLGKTKTLNLGNDDKGAPLRKHFKKGFEYSDCWVDDARLVTLNALDAQERGADIMVGYRFLSAVRDKHHWLVTVQTPDAGKIEFHAKALVNAAGPWVEKTLGNCNVAENSKSRARLVKGSHIIVPKLYEGSQCYTFQNKDNRVIFAIPYEEAYTLIGTTDVPFAGDPAQVAASEPEIDYLCSAASDYFSEPVAPADVVSSYAGIRPLYDDGAANASATTRDYHLELDTRDNTLPLLSIFGGKITTYRRLAEEALDHLHPFFSHQGAPWTESAPLPGGALPNADNPAAAMQLFKAELREKYGWLDAAVTDRLAQAYGSRVHFILGGKASTGELGTDFGCGLYEAEVRYLITTEWARSGEDILWRRSKLGLHMPIESQRALDIWVQANRANILAADQTNA